MQRSRRIVLNTVSNIVLQCVSVGVSFVMMPLVLRYFGKEVFGINAYVAGIVLLFTFISSAISMSLMKFIPESLEIIHDYKDSAPKEVAELEKVLKEVQASGQWRWSVNAEPEKVKKARQKRRDEFLKRYK